MFVMFFLVGMVEKGAKPKGSRQRRMNE